MASLDSLVQALPAELYNKIFDLTFTTDSGWTFAHDKCDIHRIACAYKPPSTLQVNRSTRAVFAKLYYGIGTSRSRATTFYISSKDAARWISSLTSGHVFLLEEVRIVHGYFKAHVPVGGLRCRLRHTYTARDFEVIAGIVNIFDSCDLRHVLSILISYIETGHATWKKLDEVEHDGFW